MGQYYAVCNLDKRQTLNPHTFDDGVKLMEFGCAGNGTMTAIAILLSHGCGQGGGDFRCDPEDPDAILVGSWAGDRVVFSGDYAPAGEHMPEELTDADKVRAVMAYHGDDAAKWARDEVLLKFDTDINLYSFSDLWEDISDRVVGLMSRNGEGRYGVSDWQFAEKMCWTRNQKIIHDYVEANYNGTNDYTWVTPKDIQRMSAYDFAPENCPPGYLNAWKKWLRSKTIMPEVREMLKLIQTKKVNRDKIRQLAEAWEAHEEKRKVLVEAEAQKLALEGGVSEHLDDAAVRPIEVP